MCENEAALQQPVSTSIPRGTVDMFASQPRVHHIEAGRQGVMETKQVSKNTTKNGNCFKAVSVFVVLVTRIKCKVLLAEYFVFAASENG